MKSKAKNPRTRELAIKAKTAYANWQQNMTDAILWQAAMDACNGWRGCYGLHGGGTLMGAGDHVSLLIEDLKRNKPS